MKRLLPLPLRKAIRRGIRQGRDGLRNARERPAYPIGGVALTGNARRLAALRGACAGKRVFVIGNGPSLRTSDLDALAGDRTIASNGIFLAFPRTSFRPTYYTVEDALVAEDRAAAINALDCDKIVPHDLRRHVRPGERTTYVRFVRDYAGFPKFSGDLARIAYWGGTVTFLNLQLAYHVGASEIVLLGVDHSYAPPAPSDHVDGAVITSRSADHNHFDPAYFGPGYRWHDPKIERMEEAYRAARSFLEAAGVKVLDATRGGKLTVFPKADLDAILARRPAA